MSTSRESGLRACSNAMETTPSRNGTSNQPRCVVWCCAFYLMGTMHVLPNSMWACDTGGSTLPYIAT